MKDIFIDTNIVKNFSNPMDPEYIRLIKWLMTYNEPAVKEGKRLKEEFAHLVVSKKLLVEYFGSARNPGNSSTSIHIIINFLKSKGRLNNVPNDQIKAFRKKYFTKTVERKLQSNEKDRNHIPIVLMSNRKMALTLDKNFKTDLENFKGFTVQVQERPQDLDYD